MLASSGEKLRRLAEVLDGHGLPKTDHALLLALPIQEDAPLVLNPEARRKRTLADVLALLGALADDVLGAWTAAGAG